MQVAPVVDLHVLAGILGNTEPCGCTSDPLGGIDRATRLMSTRRSAHDAFIVLGNSFYDSPRPPERLRAQQRAKAELIAQVLGKLQPAVMVLGAFDYAAEAKVVAKLLQQNDLTPLQVGRGDHPISYADSVIKNIGGRRIGFVGISGDIDTRSTVKPTTAYSATAQGLRAQGAEVVIALVPLGPGENTDAFISDLNAVDIAITQGGDEPSAPRVIRGTLAITPPNKGQYLGHISLHWPTNTDAPKAPGWLFDDEGKTAQKSLQARIKRLKAGVERLEAGPARASRQEKLTRLQTELAGFKSTPPRSRYVSYDDIRIDRKVEPDPWAARLLAVANKALCAPNILATEKLECAPALTAAERYTANDCTTCHAEAVKFWEGTKHAQAWKTLTNAGKECDLGCIGCHTVGYEKPGGYCKLSDAEAHANVRCENCHGPAEGHVKNPKAKDSGFMRNPPAALCLECHTSDHSDLFDFEVYRKKILGPGHGR